MSSEEEDLTLSPNTLMEINAQRVVQQILPPKSQEKYLKVYDNFVNWRKEKLKYNMSKVSLCRNIENDSYDLTVPNLAKLSLMLGDELLVKPHHGEDIFVATIESKSKDVVSLAVHHSQFRKYCFSKAKFDIKFLKSSRTSFKRMHCAVESMQNSSDLRHIFPLPNDVMTPPYKIQKFYNNLILENPEQRSAVEHIVGGTAGAAPYLLHGPPGTGKTVTIVEAILQLVTKDPRNHILVCTESNMAADHVADALIKYAKKFQNKKFLLRACSMSRDWETLPKSLEEYTNKPFLHEQTVKQDVYGLKQVQDRRLQVQLERMMFMRHSIVVSTLSYAASFAKNCSGYPITHLFIDEAAQASEPASLIPICGLLSPKGILTLSGDPLQLGPVIISHHARELGLGLSLMERLMTKCDLYNAERNDVNYIVKLRNNFRSDPAVLRIPNHLFYNKQLKALAALDPLSSVDILGERARSRAIVFHGVLSKEQRLGKSPSFFNDEELELVERYIEMLIIKHKVLPEHIGVVTPYSLQVSKIKDWLDGTSWSDRIEVGTVEAFQGKEKRVIIISTVRSGSQLGFLVDDQRFNVALTRAKAKAVVIGNPLCLENDAKWHTYMQLCRKYGTYCGHDPMTDEATLDDLADRFRKTLK